MLVEVDVHSRTAGADRAVLDEAVSERLDHLAEQERQRALRRLGDGISEGLAVTGIEATVRGLRQAQVHLLIVDFAALADRTLIALADEPWIAASRESVTGTDVLGEVDAADALLRAGAFTHARLLPVDGRRIDGPDGVAALLRWSV